MPKKKFSYGAKTVEVKLPNDCEKHQFSFNRTDCYCSMCHWMGEVDSLKQSVKLRSVNLLCPDCSSTIAEVSYHFSSQDIPTQENLKDTLNNNLKNTLKDKVKRTRFIN